MDKPWLAHYEEVVPSTLEYPTFPLHCLLEDAARRYRGHPAVTFALRYLGPVRIGAVLSYAQVLDQANRFASALHALGVRKGDRVAVALPNLPQFIVAFFGAVKLGAIVVNTNPLYTARELQHQLADAGAETVVLLSSMVARLDEIREQTAVSRVIVTDVADYLPLPGKLLAERTLRKAGLMAGIPAGPGLYRFRPLLAAHPEPPPDVATAPDDVALFQYTGGTTGLAKAAMLTHRNLVVNAVQMRHWMPALCDGCETVMGALPLFHVYGMTLVMLCGTLIGANTVLIPNPRDIDHVMAALQAEKATFFPGVPAMYAAIIHRPDIAKYDFRAIKACISGSAPLPIEVQVKFGEITGGRLVEGYGLSETSPVTHANPVYGERRAGSIGLPIPDTEARIVDPDTLDDKAAGEPGELWVRGPQVMPGYWNKPEETSQTLMPGGWLRTGDIARMDADGYFYIVDRLKDLIIVSGFNVVPREVEEVLYQHPAVQEACVVGVPDRRRGELIKAYLVLKPGQAATPEEITAFCRERLTAYKVPRQIEFRAQLPKTIVGKHLRRQLVEEEKQKQAARAEG